MRRFLGIACGLLTHAFFFATLPPLYRFLRNDFAAAPTGPLWIDAAAAVQFAIPHSVLLHPATRRWITRRLPSPFYGLLFCCATCASLWVMFAVWRGSPVIVWAWPERCRTGRRSWLFPFLGDSVLQSEFNGAWLPDGSHALVALGAGTACSTAAVSARRNVPLRPPSRLSQFFRTRLADTGRHARSCTADRPVDRLRRDWQLPQRRTPFPTDRGAVPAVSKRGAGLSLPESTWLAFRRPPRQPAFTHHGPRGR